MDLLIETIKVTVSPAKLAKLGSTKLEFKCVASEK